MTSGTGWHQRIAATVPCSVVIAAKDEAAEIGECIASVAWAAEIIVVENDSSDDTVAIARSAGATVFSHPFTTIGRQRNAAIARARHEWILVVDADERGTGSLRDEIARIVFGRGEGRRVPRPATQLLPRSGNSSRRMGTRPTRTAFPESHAV